MHGCARLLLLGMVVPDSGNGRARLHILLLLGMVVPDSENGRARLWEWSCPTLGMVVPDYIYFFFWE